MRLIILIILIVGAIGLQAQTIEELKGQLSGASDIQKANIENSISEAYSAKRDYSESINFAKDAIKHAKASGSSGEELRGSINAGNGSKKAKEYKNAIGYFKEVTSLAESAGRKDLVAYGYESIGYSYGKLKEVSKSTKYYKKCLDVEDYKGKDKAYVLRLVAYNYYVQDDYKTSLKYYNQSSDLYDANPDPSSHARMLINMGSVYAQYGDLSKAKAALNKAIKMAEKNNLGSTLTSAKQTLATIDKNKETKENQVSDFDQELIQEKESYIDNIERENAHSLAEIENLSIENQVKQLKLLNQQNELQLKEQEAEASKRELEKTALENAKTSAELKAAEAEGAMTMAWLVGAGIALVLVMVLAVMAARNNKKLKSKNAQIAAQNKELDNKNKSITESINYARKIQNALLASNLVLGDVFSEHLIFSKPRDIVSGDFSWCDNNGSDCIIVLADCTGHGVPGALMSVLAISSLEKIVKQAGTRSPEMILQMLNDDLFNLFGQNKQPSTNQSSSLESSVKDRMDIVIIRIHKLTKTLVFAGSRNTMIKVSDGELEELKGSKAHLGYNKGHEDFNSQQVQLKSGDAIYLFSDGFYDQKGGEEGKKFYPKRFRDMLTEHASESMEGQSDSYEKILQNWSKGKEQVDDILILGVRV
ncbi:MAG: SpoIIE family protein phosphatase [Flavobacteriales bacterium]|nr:SpoIIE family protein phosphatase [Flavobacteriales bacterium]